jgi:hypothetical protein
MLFQTLRGRQPDEQIYNEKELVALLVYPG